MSYKDHIDPEDFRLFLRFNNKEERMQRHVDVYFIDEPGIPEHLVQERVERNYKALMQSLRKQVGDLSEEIGGSSEKGDPSCTTR